MAGESPGRRSPSCPKIAQIDALISPALEHRIIEVHPECSFREMAGHALESKHSDGGLRQREALVVERFGAIPLAPQGARRDDLLDAYATLWTATRFARGEHYEFGDGGRDDRGLLMRIVV